MFRWFSKTYIKNMLRQQKKAREKLILRELENLRANTWDQDKITFIQKQVRMLTDEQLDM